MLGEIDMQIGGFTGLLRLLSIVTGGIALPAAGTIASLTNAPSL
jgi:hypothetical protein